MEELRVFENQEQKTITTLEIAKMMEVRHSDILAKLEGNEKSKGIISVLAKRKIPLSDYFALSAYKDASGKENKCYNVTKLGCDFLANKFTGEKGIIFTALYVKRFDEMERALMPKDYPAALRAYADEYEKRMQTEQENKMLLEENDRMKPKAEFFDELVDRSLLVNFRDAAKTLGIKPSDFMKFLKEKKYIYHDAKGNIRPYENKNDGLFELKAYTSKYSDHAGEQTLLTPKGLETFRLLLKDIT